jgi:hypothetical protein
MVTAVTRPIRAAGDARIAVQFVVNVEEGGRKQHSARRPRVGGVPVRRIGAQPWPGQRHANIESMYEYGSRAGFWRLWRIFTERFVKAQGFKKMWLHITEAGAA